MAILWRSAEKKEINFYLRKPTIQTEKWAEICGILGVVSDAAWCIKATVGDESGDVISLSRTSYTWNEGWNELCGLLRLDPAACEVVNVAVGNWYTIPERGAAEQRKGADLMPAKQGQHQTNINLRLL